VVVRRWCSTGRGGQYGNAAGAPSNLTAVTSECTANLTKPTNIGDIAKTALVLTHFEHRYLQ
jgi:hypothetical protein